MGVDNYADKIRGGQIIIKGPSVASNVMCLDNNSLYPSVVACAGISPESCCVRSCPIGGSRPGECVVDWHVLDGRTRCTNKITYTSGGEPMSALVVHGDRDVAISSNSLN